MPVTLGTVANMGIICLPATFSRFRQPSVAAATPRRRSHESRSTGRPISIGTVYMYIGVSRWRRRLAPKLSRSVHPSRAHSGYSRSRTEVNRGVLTVKKETGSANLFPSDLKKRGKGESNGNA